MKTSIFSPLLFLPAGTAEAAIHFKHFLLHKNISFYPYNKSIHRKHSNINDFVAFKVFPLRRRQRQL
jgi:hypothetical protein